MRITLTGLDERTSVLDMIQLSKLGAEIGLLYTASPDGRRRYPARWWVETRSAVVPCAIHICGSRARSELHNGMLNPLLASVRRFQVNGNVTTEELRAICGRFPDKVVITQHCAKNAALARLGVWNHAILVDDSGGRGKLPGAWCRPETTKPVGFAGGLGPDTLRSELPKIARVADTDSWVDMEGRLRDDEDWFSVEKAMKALAIWREFQ